MTWHFRQLRGVKLGAITRGVVYEHGDCDDLEALYCHLVSLAGGAGQSGAMEYDGKDDVVDYPPDTDTPWRKAAAWRGKLTWRDRLKPSGTTTRSWPRTYGGCGACQNLLTRCRVSESVAP